ncbi:MAG TPA: hypothetical protein VIL55_10520 [Naasia sp.]|jgi:hypothetical protein
MTHDQDRTPDTEERRSVAVWYFVGATFLFAGSSGLLSSGGTVLGVLGLVLGVVVFSAGCLLLRQEMRHKSKQR